MVAMQAASFSAGIPFKINVRKNPIQNNLDALNESLPPLKERYTKEQAQYEYQADIEESEEPLPASAQIPLAFYPNEIEKVENPSAKCSRYNIRHSVHKLAMVASMIKGKHLYDAQQILNNTHKKASHVFLKVVNSARNNAVQQGMQEERLFIKEIICGKAIMQKKIDIKGRSKMGIILVPKCHVKLVIEEKPLEEYYELLLKGECPASISTMMRTMLVQSEAQFETVQKMNFMLTSKGRQYRKLQFKRLCQFVEKEFRKVGHPVNKKIIERNILAKVSKEWATNSRHLQDRMVFGQRSDRQAIFNAGYTKK